MAWCTEVPYTYHDLDAQSPHVEAAVIDGSKIATKINQIGEYLEIITPADTYSLSTPEITGLSAQLGLNHGVLTGYMTEILPDGTRTLMYYDRNHEWTLGDDTRVDSAHLVAALEECADVATTSSAVDYMGDTDADTYIRLSKLLSTHSLGWEKRERRECEDISIGGDGMAICATVSLETTYTDTDPDAPCRFLEIKSPISDGTTWVLRAAVAGPEIAFTKELVAADGTPFAYSVTTDDVELLYTAIDHLYTEKQSAI